MDYNSIRSILQTLTAISEDAGVNILVSEAEISRSALKVSITLECEGCINEISISFYPKYAVGSLRITGEDPVLNHYVEFGDITEIAGMLVSWGMDSNMEECWSGVTDEHLTNFLNFKGELSYLPKALDHSY